MQPRTRPAAGARPAPAVSFAAAAVAALLAVCLAAVRMPAPAQAQGMGPLPLDAFGRGLENAGATAPATPGPRLVVAVILDQYRDDFLDRHRPVLGRDGLRRLIDGGARFRDCTIPYALTVTAPGHATWLSGAPPSVHGITGNDWFDRAEGRMVNAVNDDRYAAVGVPGRGQPASPARMRAAVVGDMLRAATRGAGRVMSISDKPRGAVLPGGRQPDGAYWLDGATGRMQTSTYYRTALPAWAAEANQAREARIAAALRTPWTPLLAAEAYLGTYVGDRADVFPHPLRAPGADERDAPPASVDLAGHPLSLEALFDFAEAAVAGEELGDDAVPDLLVLSVSVSDAVGHRFGPDSPEVLDLVIRTDRRLAAFLSFLDRRVGRGHYSVALTSDHGVAPSPAFARAFEAGPTDSVGGYPTAEFRGWIDRVLAGALGERGQGLSRFARTVPNGVVTFDDSVLGRARTSRAEAARILADSACANPWLAAGYTAEDLGAGRVADPLARRVLASHHPGRSGDVILVPRPWVFFGSRSAAGSSHGTPYRYDTHVPLVFWGWGVSRGVHGLPVSTLDIAPTVAALLGVPAPPQSDGRVLVEALGPPRDAAR